MSDDTASRNTATLSTPYGAATLANAAGDALLEFIVPVFAVDADAVDWTRADITWANTDITWATTTYAAA